MHNFRNPRTRSFLAPLPKLLIALLLHFIVYCFTTSRLFIGTSALPSRTDHLQEFLTSVLILLVREWTAICAALTSNAPGAQRRLQATRRLCGVLIQLSPEPMTGTNHP